MSGFRAPGYIRAIRPYPPGKPVDLLQRELGLARIVQLASNENTAGPSPLVAEAILRALPEVQYYPDGGGHHLRRRLADLHGLDPGQVVLGNGSGELVDLLCHAFLADGDPVVLSSLAFVQFKLSALAVNARLVEVPVEPEDRSDAPQALGESAKGARLAFLANPNNPTGAYLSRAELDAYFEAAGSAPLTVVDQAYHEYVEAPDYPDAVADLKAGGNVIVLRTFSKAHGLAGLRIGYALGPADLLAQMEGARLPFNTNVLGQVAALAALDDLDHARRARDRNAVERPFLAGELARRGFRVVPSVANFLLVDLPPGLFPEAAAPGVALAERLLRLGVWVRPMAGYGLPQSLRTTVGTRAENELLLAALDRLGPCP
jgi:histidinol-phosphate aminotransferase